MIFLIVVSGLIVFYTWYKYFKLICVFHNPNLGTAVVFSFLLGGLAMVFVYIINNFFNYYWINATLEEFIKLICFVCFYNLFESNFKNPIDYILYVCFICLGFSLFENALKISNETSYNFYILKRSILGPIGHMISSCLIVYGFVKYKFSSKNTSKLIMLKYVFFGLFFHFFTNLIAQYKNFFRKSLDVDLLQNIIAKYPFIPDRLIQNLPEKNGFNIDWGVFILCLIFLIGISIFSTIIINCLNNSKDFTYSNVIDSKKILKIFTQFLGLLFVIEIVVFLVLNYTSLNHSDLYVYEKTQSSFLKSLFEIVIFALLFYCLSIRLSRFKFLKNRWKKLRIETPFVFFRDNYFIRFRGGTNDELQISMLHKKEFNLCPVYKNKKFIKSRKRAFLEEKIIDDKDESYFLIKLFKSKANDDNYKYYLLKSKVGGIIYTAESFPIVEVYELKNIKLLANLETNFSNFKLMDLAYVQS